MNRVWSAPRTPNGKSAKQRRWVSAPHVDPPAALPPVGGRCLGRRWTSQGSSPSRRSPPGWTLPNARTSNIQAGMKEDTAKSCYLFYASANFLFLNFLSINLTLSAALILFDVAHFVSELIMHRDHFILVKHIQRPGEGV